MIISHSHQFLFLKSIKTAGTSIEAALSNYCSGDDIVTPLNNYAFNRDENSPVQHQAMNFEKLDWWDRETIGQHVDAKTLKNHVSEEVWKTYLKISIARNPWDRLVSLFTWRNKNNSALRPRKRFYHYLGVPYDEFRQIRKNFLEFARGDWETNDRFYILNGELCADYVIRYEDLTGSFNGLCDRMGVPRLELPRLKTGIRPEKIHYSRYYDDEAREIVAKRHKHDIRLFGYEFEEE